MNACVTDDDAQLDHVGQVCALWRKEMPDVNLDGLAILARAGRIALMTRDKVMPVLTRHGLDSGEFYVLAALRRAGAPFALRPTELFRALMVSSGGLTDRLRRLEERGLVHRIPSEEDRRSTLVGLTPKAWREDMDVENAIVAQLSKGDREHLAGLLAKLALIMGRESES